MDRSLLKEYLDDQVSTYNNSSFIENDPISIPHRFEKLQDIEISGFWTAILSWGRRKTIINKSMELLALMEFSPHDFIVNHKPKERAAFNKFKHRTFQPPDTLYFLEFLQQYYRKHNSLEECFFPNGVADIKSSLIHFHREFFSLECFLPRTKKHISTPFRKSSCKRLNMFLRWMVRKDNKGVDFGLWNKITPSKLMIPLDVHVFKVASLLGLLERNKTDWTAVEELTAALRQMDQNDPVKYDFALFGLGINNKSHDLETGQLKF